MKITVKRVYEEAEKSDGTRVLVDRLWPRGIRKSEARIDVWAKDAAPSGSLRKWFHVDPDSRHKNFVARYRKELSENSALKELRKELRGQPRVTLVTAAKDVAHSHVPVLLSRLR
jgi:uncharacterized protein YeaO (DUF488 family)